MTGGRFLGGRLFTYLGVLRKLGPVANVVAVALLVFPPIKKALGSQDRLDSFRRAVFLPARLCPWSGPDHEGLIRGLIVGDSLLQIPLTLPSGSQIDRFDVAATRHRCHGVSGLMEGRTASSSLVNFHGDTVLGAQRLGRSRGRLYWHLLDVAVVSSTNQLRDN